MKTNLRKFIIVVVAAMVPAGLRAGAVVGATEFTQIANNIQLGASYTEHVQQTLHQAEMVQNQLNAYRVQLQNVQKLDGISWDNASVLLNNLAQTVQTTQSLGYMFASQDQAYAALHKDYHTFANGIPGAGDMADTYTKWSDYNAAAANTAANAAGLTLQQASDEASRIAALKARGATANGQVQAITAGTALTAEVLDQLRILKNLSAIQMDTQARYQRIAEEKARQEATKGTTVMKMDPVDPTKAKAYGEIK